MVIMKNAAAGTLESSDALITLEPNDTLEIDIESTVMNQYGRQIRLTVLDELNALNIERGRVRVVDRGALDCTLRARLECAAFRACETEEKIPWGGFVK